MNYKMLGRFLSLILAMEAFLMLPPLGISIFDRTVKTTQAFLISILIIGALAALLML